MTTGVLRENYDSAMNEADDHAFRQSITCPPMIKYPLPQNQANAAVVSHLPHGFNVSP